jgi:ketosteroid isomerase-like protein
MVSHDTVKTVRLGYEAWNRGDLDALRAIYSPDVTAEAGELWTSSGKVSGPDAIIGAFASIFATFEHCELVAEEYIERGEVVVVPTVWQGTLVGSDSVIKEHVNAVYTLRDGRICRIAYFQHLDEALERAELECAAQETA